MSAILLAVYLRCRLAFARGPVLGGLLALALPWAALALAGSSGDPSAAQEIPIVIEDVELVAGCQIRAFMPHYRAGTPLFEIANDIEGGNPRFWFMHQGPVPLPTDLFDPASAERSVVDALTEEAGYICVDFGTLWHRPLYPPPPCLYEPPYCLPAVEPTPEPGCPCAQPPTTEPTPLPQ